LSGDAGIITSLQICPGHGLPMTVVDPAHIISDQGLEGCRHAKAGSRRQVLLIEEETLDELVLRPGLIKENITTRGIDLNSLPTDTRLLLGAGLELWITGPCDPCGLMDEIRPGLMEELRGRRGVLAWVKQGGQLRVGDRIEVIPSRQAGEGEKP